MVHGIALRNKLGHKKEVTDGNIHKSNHKYMWLDKHILAASALIPS
jgi:hypothetical protein